MTTDDEKFFAWLDGELNEAEAAEMAAKVAADPRLARLAEQHRELSQQLRAAFEPVAQAPLPSRVAAAMTGRRSDVVDIAAAGRARWDHRPRALPHWAAMAATLALGLALGVMVRAPGNAPLKVEGRDIYAAASLDQALETQLAGAPANGDVRIGLTFRDRAGDICRSFTAGSSAGLACRDEDGWRLRGVFATPEGQSGEYRMAEGTHPSLAALIDSTIADEPLDAAGEKAAKDSGWR
jgi:hypothetical protein